MGIPDEPDATFSPYQEEGARFLARRKKAICADALGLGKTATLIRVANLLRPASVLVVCPKSLVAQWEREVRRFSTDPLAYRVVNFERVLNEEPAVMLVVDESTFVKNPKALRTQNVVAKAIEAEFCYFLTATPVRNNQSDLFVPLYVIYPETLRTAHTGDEATDLVRSYYRFLDRFFVVYRNPMFNGAMQIKGVKGAAEAVFAAMVNGCLLSRTQELLGLPPLEKKLVAVDWGAGQERTYQDALEGVLRKTEEDESIPNVLAQMTRLRQCALDPGLCGAEGESGKTRWLVEHLSQDTRPALIFSNFAEYCKRLGMGGSVAVLTGDMAAKERDFEVRQFMEGRTDIFVISAQAGGYGLNLQRAQQVIWTDLPWTPDVWEQGTGRAYRRGQEHPVTEWVLGHPNSIDGKLLRVLRRKGKVATATLAMKAVLKELRG
ncbi:DEAD/DEAH box helicase [Thiomonas sp.]